jgi:dTDP-4-amino-4,6-dideoxygalactose transaminase
MIKWVSNKYSDINMENIQSSLIECSKTNQFTNNGIHVLQTIKEIKKIFEIDEEKEVLMTCNGAMGLNAIIGGFDMFYNKRMRWIVQSFTFPCSKQGNLIDSIIVDIDDNMGPNINDLYDKIDEYDGIVVTNCFGASTNIVLYETFCRENNKLLVFDNAASPLTYYKDKNILNYGNACIVSLHHTKPIGFGEGGFIIFDKKILDSMEKTICFGYTKKDRQNYDKNASNYKMSEISCIFITEYLKNIKRIYHHHTSLISYFIKQLYDKNLNNKVKLFRSFSDYERSLMSTIPLIFNEPTDTECFTKNNIEAKKYYYPLDKNCVYSMEIFDKIICLPLNLDITYSTIDFYIQIIESF